MSTLFSHFFTKINQISPLETNFTEVLDGIALKPKTLYFRGKMPENVVESGKSVRPLTVAIVGSRHNTLYGEEIARDLSFRLAKKGVIIVSGLAFGIDSIGHRGCLDAGGTTVAVLGNPIDKIQPSNHTALAAEIVAHGGAIISEYPPTNSKAPLAPGEFLNERGQRKICFKSSFLYRNRLISALSDIVVVVEAGERSGSLNTATHALAQGKTVFAVPGNITSPYSQGCNKLLQQGALVYTGPDDVLRELFPADFLKKSTKRQSLVGDTDLETTILGAIAKGLRSGEEIMRANNLPPELFNQTITVLEIKGRVRALGLNNWALA